MDGYVNKTQFAQIYGCSKPYISQLVAARRVVLSEDGKLVNVEASLKLLDVTADPSKAGVKERWQAVREGRDPATVTTATATSPAAPQVVTGEPVADLAVAQPSAPAGQAAPAAAAAPISSAYHDARTQREQAEARMAQIELMEKTRQVAEIEPVLRAMTDSHIAARTEVLALPDRLTQLVVAQTDARKVYDIIAHECERVCERVQRRVEALAAQHSAVTA